MKTKSLICGMTALLSLGLAPIQAQQYDPPCVVEQWSNASTYDKVIDINFSDADSRPTLAKWSIRPRTNDRYPPPSSRWHDSAPSPARAEAARNFVLLIVDILH